MAAEYEVNIKINSQEIERELGKIDRIVAKIGKPKGGGSRRKPGIAGLLPSSEELRAAEKGIVQLTAKTKNIQNIQDKFSERRTRALTRSIALNEKDLRLNKQMTAEARARLRLLSQSGAKGFDATRPKGRQLADDINARAKAQDKRSKLANKINEIEAKGLNVAKLRKRLGKATTEQARGRFAGAQKEFRLLQRTIDLEQSKLRILKEQRKGFPSSPIQGTATMAGSPKQIAEFNKQAARDQRKAEREDRRAEANRRQEARIRAQEQRAFQGQLRAGVGPESVFGPLRQLGRASMIAGADEAKLLAGRFRAPSSPLTARPVTRASAAQAAQQVEELVKARAAAEKRATDDAAVYKMRADKRVLRAQLALDQIEYKNKIDDIEKLAQRQIKEGERAGREFDRELKRREKARKDTEQARIKGRNRRIGNAALGAGFPLLFGGGPGSVVGGALGGAFGGGLAAQIGLSALGQQIDQFVASMVNAGKALTSVSGAADFMAEKSLFSSDAMQFRIEKLIEEGKVTEAAALMTKEMAKQVGGSGLKALKDLGDEANKMGKLFNALILQVQAFISRALTPLLAAINKVVGDVVLNNQFNALMSEATGARRKEIEKFLKPYTKKVRKGAAAKDRVTSEGRRLAVEKFGGQVIPEGAAIEPTGLELLRAADRPDRGADKAAGEEERLQKRLAKLEEERQKIIEISRFRDQIAAAEALGDTQLVIRLQGEQKIAEIEASRKEALIGVTDQREIEAINIVKATEKLAAHREIERQITEEQRMRQEVFDDTVADLEYQLALSQATSEAERERLRIEEKLRKLRKGGMSEERVGEIGSLMQQLSEENNPLNKFIKQSTESLNNLEQHAVQVSQGIGNAIGNSLVSGMQNLVTGATSVKEVFADMLKSIADVLAKQAAQMIATYIAIGIARAFAGMGTSGGDPNSAAVGEVLQGGGFTTGNLADAAASTPLKLNAAGSYVSGPTATLVGEGGESEYIIPESKMRESMARYSRGARGSSVIPDSGVSGTSSEGGGTAVAAPIDIRYTVERINNVDYVTADQFMAGMQRAVDEGAKQGEQKTLRRLQMSGSTRKRLGL